MTGTGEPNGDRRYVTWARWDAEHNRLRDQLTTVAADIAELRAVHEADMAALAKVHADRRNRLWMLTLAVLSSLVLPLLVVTIVTLATAFHH